MVPLSTQVYKWVPVNLMLGVNLVMDYNPIQGGVEILLVTSSTETGINSSMISHLTLIQTEPYGRDRGKDTLVP